MLVYVLGTSQSLKNLMSGIWLSRETNTNIVGYSYADWAGCVDDKKSTCAGSTVVFYDNKSAIDISKNLVL